ncbi:MAG: putative DNA-binding domain-containing protein [Paraperlucidibaca sp.]
MLPEFQRLQYAFTAHLRDPQAAPAPAGIKPERLATYRELLFNNVINFVDITFPIAKAQLGEALWSRLTQRFFADFHCTSPFFYDISLHFREFTAALDWPELIALPWLESLMHYEWMELVADIDERPLTARLDADALSHSLADNQDPHLQLAGPAWALAYQWRVHEWRESTDVSIVAQQSVCLMALRADDAALSLQIHEITPFAAFLLETLTQTEAPVAVSELIARVCSAMPQARSQEVASMVRTVLRDLIAHGLRLQLA